MAIDSDYVQHQTEVAFSFLCEVANKFHNISFTSIEINENLSIPLHTTTLDDVIAENITNYKGVILFIHAAYDTFFDQFFRNLMRTDIAELIIENFSLIGWDIKQEQFHPTLKKCLETYNMTNLVPALKTKQCSAFLLVPINGIPVAKYVLRSKITDKEILIRFQEAADFLKSEKKEEGDLELVRNRNHLDNDINAVRFQQIMAERLGDRDYDNFDYDEHNELKSKIGFCYFGMPLTESGYDEKQNKTIETMYEIICEQSRLIAEHRGRIIISFIYNCTEPLPKEKGKRAAKDEKYDPDSDFSPVPIFVLRKCQSSIEEPCRIFIDDIGRVYNTWTDYLKKNKLPECEMLLPLNGRYEFDKNGNVLLEPKKLSPACDLDAKILFGADIVGMVGGIASASIFGAAMIPALTVPPVALLVGTGIGVTVGVYTIGRSIYNLVDRGLHKETLSFANSEARAAYLTIVAGSLGFVGAGANLALSQMIQRGVNITEGAHVVINTINVANIGASGATLINSGYDVFDKWYNENQRPSFLTILQLSSSVLFFGNAVYNFRTVGTIVDETQAKVLQDYQDSLRSNRHRKTFTKMMKETIRQNGGDAVRGKAEVISTIRQIQNKDEVFATLTRNNKEFNRKGVRFAASNGKISLNGVLIDMAEFGAMNKNDAISFIDSIPSQIQVEIPSNEATSLKTNITNIFSNISTEDLLKIYNTTERMINMYKFDVKLLILEAVDQLLKHIGFDVMKYLKELFPNFGYFPQIMRVVLKFLSKSADELEIKYQRWIQYGNAEDFLPIFNYINVDKVKRYITLFEYGIDALFIGNQLRDDVLKALIQYFVTWFTNKCYTDVVDENREQKRRLHSANYKSTKTKCTICQGYYFVPLKK